MMILANKKKRKNATMYPFKDIASRFVGLLPNPNDEQALPKATLP